MRAPEMTIAEMENETMTELPGRELLAGISLLGIPLVGVDGVTVNISTGGPGWLFHG